MTSFSFEKYHGCGNDFIMVLDPDNRFPLQAQKAIKSLCHRRFGIGADGLIVLQKHDLSHFRMVYFNADGHLGSLCGNGARCAVQFANAHGWCKTNKLVLFEAADGLHQAEIITQESENSLIRLQMTDVEEIEQLDGAYFLDTGSPHWVQFIDDLSVFDVLGAGRQIRYNDRFKEIGTNVNFVALDSDGGLFVRTYERGVEDETLACGTGVTASALAAHLHLAKEKAHNSFKIRTLGGLLEVSYTLVQTANGVAFQRVFLTGPAQKVFEGSFTV